MSSLGDIQQVYQMLQEIDRILTKLNANLKTMETQTKATTESWKDLEQVSLRYLTLMSTRANLPEDQQKAITVLAQVAVAAYAAQLAVTSFMAATGPVGIAFAAMGLMMSGLSIVETADTYLRRPKY